MAIKQLNEFRAGVVAVDPKNWIKQTPDEVFVMNSSEYLKPTDGITGRKGKESSISKTEDIYLPNFLYSNETGSIATRGIILAIEKALQANDEVVIGANLGFKDISDTNSIAKPLELASSIPEFRRKYIHIVSHVDNVPIDRLKSDGSSSILTNRKGKTSIAAANYQPQQLNPNDAQIEDGVLNVALNTQNFQATPTTKAQKLIATVASLADEYPNLSNSINTHRGYVYVHDGKSDNVAKQAIDHSIAIM